ncbi:MAG: hypothetical protein ACLQVN_09275 [Bryobacteraceae bacterium]
MRGLAWILAWWMVAPMVPAARAQDTGPRLNLVIVEGEGAINNVRQRTAREAIVQVQDENHKPVAGASVIFLLPSQGAGGEFANGSHTLAVTSDSQGNAIARGFRPNQAHGQFQMHVNASFNGRTGSTDIHMSNVAAAAGATATVAGMSVKLFVVLVAVGAAAAAGGAYYATHSGGGNSATAASVVTLTPGTGTVGGPGQ